MIRISVGAVIAAASVSAIAGFSIEGSPAISTEWGPMGNSTPYESEARGAFRTSAGVLEPRQSKYAEAELLVDLAYTPLTQKGTGPAVVVDGFADEVPFETAMIMVLPQGWQLYRGLDLVKRDVPEVVSYSGGKPWPEVLKDLGDTYGLRFHLDWYDRTVMMSMGRSSPAKQISKIRVISEPVAEAAAISPTSRMTSEAARTEKPTVEAVATAAPSLPRPLLKSGNESSVAHTQPASVEAEKLKQPSIFAIQINSGTLHENVVRLSKENGWAAPAWEIHGDFKIATPYKIEASNFAEAMVKLLMIHPIEADVNTAQRKVLVIKEIL